MLFHLHLPPNTYQFERPEPQHDNPNRLKVCPTCCTLWCRLTGLPNHPYAVDAVACKLCITNCHFSQVPGSLLACSSAYLDDIDLLNYLPRELLEREFHLTLRAIENANIPHSAATWDITSWRYAE